MPNTVHCAFRLPVMRHQHNKKGDLFNRTVRLSPTQAKKIIKIHLSLKLKTREPLLSLCCLWTCCISRKMGYVSSSLTLRKSSNLVLNSKYYLSITIYLPSCSSKPLWVTWFCGNQSWRKSWLLFSIWWKWKGVCAVKLLKSTIKASKKQSIQPKHYITYFFKSIRFYVTNRQYSLKIFPSNTAI